MTLKLVDRSVSKPIGITKDVSFKFGVFHFPADFVEELTLRIGNEAITYKLDQTVRYSANYNQVTANKIDVIESACEEYSQEVLGFSNVTASGTPTPQNDLIISATSPSLTPFGDSDFLLFEEADAFLGLKDDPDLPKVNPFYYDLEGDILLLEAILNKVELKHLPHHLEYAFLEGDNKLPIIIAKELGDEEKYALIKGLKSHKRAIAWKLSYIQGINPDFCTHKILMEEDYKPAVQHQRRVNPKIHDVIKKEVEKLLNAGLIYPISDSPWFMDQMLKRLAENEYYCFLDGFSSIVHTDHSALKYLFAKKDAKARFLWWVLLLQEFDFQVLDTKGAENPSADHLSRLENPYENVLDPKRINETFPLETLSMVTFHGDSSAPWFADFANYHAGNFIVKAHKTPIGCALYKLVYGKKLENKLSALDYFCVTWDHNPYHPIALKIAGLPSLLISKGSGGTPPEGYTSNYTHGPLVLQLPTVDKSFKLSFLHFSASVLSGLTLTFPRTTIASPYPSMGAWSSSSIALLSAIAKDENREGCEQWRENSGSTTIHADISLPNSDHFHFKIEPDPGELTSIVDSEIRENVLFSTNVNLPFEDDHSPLFTYVVWIFLPFLTIAWIMKTHACGFILRSLDLHFLSFILGIQYPNLID
nr:hypothetical protein [Tanacetum cinerariifolium]